MKNIKFISGFGEKEWSVAIYVDNNLFSNEERSRDFPDKDSPVMQLINKIAQEANITIENIVAHPCFHLTFYYNSIPENIKKYNMDIKNFYDSHQSFSNIIDYYYENHPSNIDGEMNVVNKVYELNGGGSEKFPAFYQQYLTKLPPIFNEPLWNDYITAAHKPHSKNSENHLKIHEQLKDTWRERLNWVWCANKEFEPYKKSWIAKQEKKIK